MNFFVKRRTNLFSFRYLSSLSWESQISRNKDRIRSKTNFINHARFRLVCTCQLHAGVVTHVYVYLPAYMPLSRSRIHASLLSVFRLARVLTWACGTGFLRKSRMDEKVKCTRCSPSRLAPFSDLMRFVVRTLLRRCCCCERGFCALIIAKSKKKDRTSQCFRTSSHINWLKNFSENYLIKIC